MKLDAIRIILIETSHPGNIGATARAMKTMGLSRLYLVRPLHRCEGKDKAMAAQAFDVLENASITETLEEALRGAQLIIGTSARTRGLALEYCTPHQAATLIAKQADETEIAILFGREDSGLTNEELLLCHYHLHIPTNPLYSSLNLAQAVQIVAYELRMQILNPVSPNHQTKDTLASFEDMSRFYAHLEAVMLALGFYKPKTPGRLLARIRRLFNRAKLEDMEVNILRGILTQVEKLLKKDL